MVYQRAVRPLPAQDEAKYATHMTLVRLEPMSLAQ